jgi:glycosyltransferase involved in cell wall biosynthesis
MRILVTHGYLLTGTGSNLYVSNLVRELCRAGHDVYLVCQEYHPENLDYVHEVYAFTHRNTALVKLHSQETPYAGRCKLFRPDLERLLPVYVFDHYPGFTVKEFPACSDAEIRSYIELNRRALMTILAAFPVDVIQTNHTIMFPYIVSQLPNGSQYPHLVTIHGSALNFSVKKDARLIPYARTGFEAAQVIIVDSAYAREELYTFLNEHGMTHLADRVHIVPAGVDTETFEILRGTKQSYIAAFIEHMQPVVQGSKGRTAAQTARMFERLPTSPLEVDTLLQTIRGSYDYHHVDRDVIEKIRTIDWDNDRVVTYVGKYLWTKGIHLLLLAIPLILQHCPHTKFLLIGFGPFREIAEYMVNCLAQKRLDLLQRVLARPRSAASSLEAVPLPLLADNLQSHAKMIHRALQSTAPRIRDAVIFTGPIDHANLKYLLPCSDVLVAPSVFPEAFGMVAVEALACGVLPIVTYQSGLKEIVDIVEAHIAAYDLSLNKVPLSADACVYMAQNIGAFFAFQEQHPSTEQARAFKQSLRTIATTLYSWQGIATLYVHLYCYAREH